MGNFNDASFNHVLPAGPVNVVATTVTSNVWTPVSIPTDPIAPDRYFLTVEPQPEPLEIRFANTGVGYVIPANVQWSSPWPIARNITPEIKRASAGVVRVLVGFPAV